MAKLQRNILMTLTKNGTNLDNNFDQIYDRTKTDWGCLVGLGTLKSGHLPCSKLVTKCEGLIQLGLFRRYSRPPQIYNINIISRRQCRCSGSPGSFCCCCCCGRWWPSGCRRTCAWWRWAWWQIHNRPNSSWSSREVKWLNDLSTKEQIHFELRKIPAKSFIENVNVKVVHKWHHGRKWEGVINFVLTMYKLLNQMAIKSSLIKDWHLNCIADKFNSCVLIGSLEQPKAVHVRSVRLREVWGLNDSRVAPQQSVNI